jgi:hypothetical protein
MGDTEDLRDKSWRDMAFRWLFSQGVSTILLFAILGGVWYGLPASLAKIQDGYERIEKADDRRYETIRQHNAEMLKYVVDQCCGSDDDRTRATAGNP